MFEASFASADRLHGSQVTLRSPQSNVQAKDENPKGVPLPTKKSKKSIFTNRSQTSPNASKRHKTYSSVMFEASFASADRLHGSQVTLRSPQSNVQAKDENPKGVPLPTKKSKKSIFTNRSQTSPNASKRHKK